MNKEEISKLAKLANLELSDERIEELRKDIEFTLEQIDKINDPKIAAELEVTEPLVNPLDLTNKFREDNPSESLTVDEALSSAPKRIDDYFSVPAVFGE